MWLMTRYGMFSTVCGRKQQPGDIDGKFTGALDTQALMVRARWQEHLERLVKRFPVLQPYPIQESTNNDYRFRIVVPKHVWADVMMALAEDVDYGNFKNEAGRVHGHQSPYLDVLHRVWSLGYDMQTRRHGRGPYGDWADNDGHEA